MANKYKVTEMNGEERTVEAEFFQTRGDFVDFTDYVEGQDTVVLRLRAAQVYEVELVRE